MTFLTPVTPNDPGWIFRPHNFCRGGQADACTWVTWPYPIICRRSSVFSENDLFDPCDPYVTFDPNLVMWHKWDGQPVLVTKSGQNRSSHVGDIRLWSVDRRRRRRRTRSGNRSGHSRMIFAGGSDPKLTLTPWMELRVSSLCIYLMSYIAMPCNL